MEINLVGKFSNTWGAEWFIKEGFEALGHEVLGFDIQHGYAILRGIKSGALTVVLQGYGMPPKLIEAIQRITKKPVVLWHAEVMSPEWPTKDGVVLGKAEQLAQNAYAIDVIGHNCHCCLTTVERIRDRLRPEREGGKPVFWAPNNGVSHSMHRRIEGVEKKYPIGAYGYLSPRRVELLRYLESNGIHVEYRRPEDQCFGEELMRFINQCHVILNYHYSETPNTETRIYESLGCGVPVLSEPISMPELFPISETAIFYFYDYDSLLAQARAIITMATHEPQSLADFGARSMTWLHANASYAQRCQNFLDQVRTNLPC
jgi:hypothetical protein